MMVRRKQMSALTDEAQRSFERSLIQHLRDTHPIAGALPPEDVTSRVRQALERGRGYGFAWQSTLASFVLLTFSIHPRFDEHPPIRRMLTSNSVPTELRVDALMAGLPLREWEEASKLPCLT